MKRRPRSLEEAELRATMLVNENVEAPPERRGSALDIDAADVGFLVGFACVAAGLALVWVPLALVFVGVGLALAAWRVA
jgi:hypothetical protein